MDHIIRKHKNLKSKKRYFTQETEDAIVEYNNSSDPIERSKIYEDKIHYPFYKLTQNLIHTFKFYYTEVENLEDLQHEVMIFLLEKIHLFNPNNGAKAYSYFGTIAKNYLILQNQKNYKKRLNNTSISDLNDYSYSDFNNPTFITSQKTEKALENIKEDFLDLDHRDGYNERLSFFMDNYIQYCTENLYTIFPKEEEAIIADSILEIFRKREFIEVFNKKALYIYIREMVNVPTPKITKVSVKLYKIFNEKYIFFLEYGYFPI